MMKLFMWSLVALFVCGSTAGAAEKKNKKAMSPLPPAAQPAPVQTQQPAPVEAQPSPEAQKQAMMDVMKKQGSPSEGHKALEPLVGEWNYTAEWRMGPDAPSEYMTGKAMNILVLGGRFLRQDISGPPMAEGMPPFEGLGFTGYDNMRKEYQTVWLDNMGTGIMRGNGSFDAATSTLKDEGTFSCPMTGETNRWYRTEWQLVDPNHSVYRSFSKAPDGQEYKSMEIQYTRAGSDPAAPN